MADQKINVGNHSIDIEVSIKENAKLNVILAHGSYNNMHYSIIQKLFDSLKREYSVMRFNFSFVGGNNNQKMDFERSVEELEACIKYMGARNIVIIGKSQGGYIGTLLAGRNDLGIKCVLVLGYPMHEPDRPHEIRHEFSHMHLEERKLPVEFIIGDSDPLWNVREAPPIFAKYRIHIIPNAGHSYKPVKPGTTADENEYIVVQLVKQVLSKLAKV